MGGEWFQKMRYFAANIPVHICSHLPGPVETVKDKSIRTLSSSEVGARLIFYFIFIIKTRAKLHSLQEYNNVTGPCFNGVKSLLYDLPLQSTVQGKRIQLIPRQYWSGPCPWPPTPMPRSRGACNWCTGFAPVLWDHWQCVVANYRNNLYIKILTPYGVQWVESCAGF